MNGADQEDASPGRQDPIAFAAPLESKLLRGNKSRDNDSDGEDHDICTVFERERKMALLKYIPSETVVVVNLKSERKRFADPCITENTKFLRPLKLAHEHPQTMHVDTHSSPRPPPAVPATYGDGDWRRKTSQWEATQREGQQDSAFVDSWICAASMELEEDASLFLANLPGMDRVNVPAGRVSKAVPAEGDPLEEAFNAARMRHREGQSPKKTRRGKGKCPTAAELNESWGFEDPDVGALVHQYFSRQ